MIQVRAKKATRVETIRWDGTAETAQEIKEWVGRIPGRPEFGFTTPQWCAQDAGVPYQPEPCDEAAWLWADNRFWAPLPIGQLVARDIGTSSFYPLSPDDTQPDTASHDDGLYGKFRVGRVDGRDQPGGDKAAARYFVLDYTQDPFARPALAAYAAACETELPKLAADLRAELGADAAHVGPPLSRISADVAEFHEMIGSPPWPGPIETMPVVSLVLRNKLIQDEVRELVTATLGSDLVGIADALADVVYVAYGTAHTYRIPLDEVLAEVHRSNMTKDPGPTGKAVKGARYSPPDVAGVLARTRAPETTRTGDS